MSQEEFEQACENGNFDLVKQMASNKNYKWNWSIESTAESGNMNIIQFLIEKGANWWNAGLNGAAQGGHMHLIHFFIEKGADIDYLSTRNLKKYNKYIDNIKNIIRSIDYNKDLLEEIVAYY